MAYENMPAAFQQAFQQNMLDRAWQSQFEPASVLRKACFKKPIPQRSGETYIYSRAGQLVPILASANPANNVLATDLAATHVGVGNANNSYPIEQFSLTISDWLQSIDINIIQDRETLASVFMQNWINLARQGALSLDLQCMQTLATAYESGTTYCTATATTTINFHVDNINGFSTAFPTVTIGSNTFPSGQPAAVSGSNTLTATLYPASGAASSTITIVGAAADGSNTSTMQGGGMINGASGILTLNASNTINTGDVIVAADAPTYVHPGTALSRFQLGASSTAAIQLVINAVKRLKRNGVPPALSDGSYLCVADPDFLGQLFTDPQFQVASMGLLESKVFTNATLSRSLGVTFAESTNLPVYSFTNSAGTSLFSKRAFVLGERAVIEGVFAGMVDAYKSMANQAFSEVRIVDDLALITRPALDSLAQIYTQSWTWIGGRVAPTDATVTSAVIPTANAARYKRCVGIEVASATA